MTAASAIFGFADDVVTLLTTAAGNGAFNPVGLAALTFTPERKVLFDLQLATARAGLLVWVGCMGIETEQASRDTDFDANEIHVGILQRLSRETFAADVDRRVRLAEDVRQYLRKHPIRGCDFESPAINPLYDHRRLLKSGLFISIVTGRYVQDVDAAEEDDDA